MNTSRALWRLVQISVGTSIVALCSFLGHLNPQAWVFGYAIAIVFLVVSEGTILVSKYVSHYKFQLTVTEKGESRTLEINAAILQKPSPEEAAANEVKRLRQLRRIAILLKLDVYRRIQEEYGPDIPAGQLRYYFERLAAGHHINLSLEAAARLVKKMEEKFGISTAPPTSRSFERTSR